ncbi:MAG: hypothetical protein LBJ46_08125 [Planctomycetota bacterium]|jgi:hypothetical protein|nr:hypothetical protein [Planctomycetota bacterium]
MDDNNASYRNASHTQVIRKFRRTTVPRARRWTYLGIALLSGILLWIGIDLRRMEDSTIEVDIEFQSRIPADWAFVTQPPRTASLLIRGSRQEINALRKENLMLLPELSAGALSGDHYTGMIALLPSQVVGQPPGIEVRAVTPDAVEINLARFGAGYVTVEPGEIIGDPAPGYVVGHVRRPEPRTTSVYGPKSILDKITSADVVRTKPFSVQDGAGVVGGMVGLEPFVKDGQAMRTPGQVYLSVELVEIPAIREFDQLFDVKALIDAPFDRYAGLTLSPPSVRVTISGPQSLVDKVSPGELTIYVDIRDRVPAAPGEYNMKCRSKAPDHIQVTKIEPDTVKWITHEAGLAQEGEGPATRQDEDE